MKYLHPLKVYQSRSLNFSFSGCLKIKKIHIATNKLFVGLITLMHVINRFNVRKQK